LIEVPITDFQKEFPNDSDAVQRRFERVDGARRRILASVKDRGPKIPSCMVPQM
jgi:hypothetical protein